jgi:hypothetical protein
VQNLVSLNNIVLDEDFTFSYWIKRTSITSTTNQFAMNIGTSDIDGKILFTGYRSTNYFTMSFGGTNFINSAATDVTPNVWIHWTGVYAATSLSTNKATIYKNGVQSATGTGGAGIYVNDKLTIGSLNGANNLLGFIDEVRIWNRALRSVGFGSLQSEIVLNYNAQFSNVFLLAFYKFDLSSDVIRDYSSNQLNLLVNGAADGTNKPVYVADNTLCLNNLPFPPTRFDDGHFQFTTDQVLTSTNELKINGAHSFSYWVRRTVTGDMYVFSVGQPVAGYMLHSGFRADSSFVFGFGGNDLSYGTNTEVNTWVHYAGTFQIGMRRLFKNGIFIYNDAPATGVNTQGGGLATVHVGAYMPGSGNFKGSIDELQIWTRTLTDLEINYVYNYLPISPTNLAVSYHFNDGDSATGSNTILDSTGGCHLTASGSIKPIFEADDSNDSADYIATACPVGKVDDGKFNFIYICTRIHMICVLICTFTYFD